MGMEGVKVGGEGGSKQHKKLLSFREAHHTSAALVNAALEESNNTATCGVEVLAYVALCHLSCMICMRLTT